MEMIDNAGVLPLDFFLKNSRKIIWKGIKMNLSQISKLLGKEGEDLLGFKAPKINKDQLHIPGPDWIERIFVASDRPNPVLRNMQLLFNTGRLAGTGYLSILPVDQGIEHSAGASFAPNPIYFDG